MPESIIHWLQNAAWWEVSCGLLAENLAIFLLVVAGGELLLKYGGHRSFPTLRSQSRVWN